MDQLSAIKWKVMEKAKFGLHSWNAERKKSFPTAARLGTACSTLAAAGGQMVPCHVMEAGVKRKPYFQTFFNY